MTITRPVVPRSAEAFIDAAPDASASPAGEPRRTMKGKQAQISHTLDPQLLNALDAFAAQNHLKRSPAINLAIRQMLKQGIIVSHTPVDQGDRS